jgi:hypothetical protein
MKRTLVNRLAVVAALTVAAAVSGPAQSGGAADAGRLVYADFQNLQNGRPVSARGGRTQLNRYAQNMANAPKFRGLENSEPPAPAPARGKADDPNIAAAFEYEVRIPNEWAGVHMEVFGNPEKDGKLVADDVSGYKFITMQIFAKGPKSIKLELISRGHGLDLEAGYPAATFRLTPGFNTYKMKLDSFRQPGWAQPINIKKDILQKLTSVTIGVHCDKCEMESGTILVDNIGFEN